MPIAKVAVLPVPVWEGDDACVRSNGVGGRMLKLREAIEVYVNHVVRGLFSSARYGVSLERWYFVL